MRIWSCPCSETPTGAFTPFTSVLACAGRVTDFELIWGEMMHAAPFHLLEEPWRTSHLRRKKTHSIGFTSVPVEIMSTVTAIRGK